MKGVLSWDGDVVLLRNERGEWELPGGRIEQDDASPQATLVREFDEELGLSIEVGALLDVWRYDPRPGRRVLVVGYRCTAPRPVELIHSHEHDAVGLFGPDDRARLDLPAGYRRCIAQAG